MKKNTKIALLAASSFFPKEQKAQSEERIQPEQSSYTEELERRLEALGLTEGSLVTVMNNDKKGALTAKFRGTRFALGKRIADNIEVKEVEGTCPEPSM